MCKVNTTVQYLCVRSTQLYSISVQGQPNGTVSLCKVNTTLKYLSVRSTQLYSISVQGQHNCTVSLCKVNPTVQYLCARSTQLYSISVQGQPNCTVSLCKVNPTVTYLCVRSSTLSFTFYFYLIRPTVRTTVVFLSSSLPFLWWSPQTSLASPVSRNKQVSIDIVAIYTFQI